VGLFSRGAAAIRSRPQCLVIRLGCQPERRQDAVVFKRNVFCNETVSQPQWWFIGLRLMRA